jgi:hypothetical protein
MKRERSLDQPRWARWVAASHAVDRLAPGSAYFVAGLGKIDAQLVHDDALYLAKGGQEQGWRDQMDEIGRFNDRFILSQLWLFGIYEVVRSLDERIDPQRGGSKAFLTMALVKQTKAVKRQLERVRMPLAKLKRGDRWQRDYDLAHPALHRKLGIAWKVADRVYVARRRLSDDALKLFEAIRDREELDQRRPTERELRRAARGN